MRSFANIALLFAFLSQFSLSSARAWSGCDCSNYKNPDSPSCPKPPVKLTAKRNCYLEQGHLMGCSSGGALAGSAAEGLRHLTESEKARDLTYGVSTDVSGKRTKGLNELLDYLSCFREETNTSSSFCNFEKNLAPDIVLAAESANTPTAVTACRYMQESKFDPNATSNLNHPKRPHAHGYNQFLNATTKQINEIIQGPLEEWKKQLADTTAKIASLKEEISRASAEKKFGLTIQLNHKKSERVELSAQVAARMVWENAWAGTPNPPKELIAGPQGSSACSHVAFIAGEMYNQFGLYESGVFKLREEHGLTVANGMDAFDTSLLGSGIYDHGTYGFTRVCRGVKSYQECDQRYQQSGGTQEPRDYMLAIKNCATQGKFGPKGKCGEATKCSKK